MSFLRQKEAHCRSFWGAGLLKMSFRLARLLLLMSSTRLSSNWLMDKVHTSAPTLFLGSLFTYSGLNVLQRFKRPGRLPLDNRAPVGGASIQPHSRIRLSTP